MDAKKIASWVALPALVLGAIITIATQWGDVEESFELLAQEASAEVATEIVNKHAEVAEARLGQLVDAGRRAEDRDLTDRCEARAERRGEDVLDYEQACLEESNLRWLWWDYDDCVLVRDDCVEPGRPRP
jgi:hypothetical protein